MQLKIENVYEATGTAAAMCPHFTGSAHAKVLNFDNEDAGVYWNALPGDAVYCIGVSAATGDDVAGTFLRAATDTAPDALPVVHYDGRPRRLIASDGAGVEPAPSPTTSRPSAPPKPCCSPPHFSPIRRRAPGPGSARAGGLRYVRVRVRGRSRSAGAGSPSSSRCSRRSPGSRSCAWPPLATVMSASMAPTIDTGDMVVLQRLGRPAQVGDIVVVNVPDDARSRYGYPPVVIHRVVRIAADGAVSTKGDARKDPDPFTVPRRALTAHVIGRIPAGGRLLAFLTSPLGLLWLGGGALFLVGLPLLERKREGQQTVAGELQQLRAERESAHERCDVLSQELQRVTQTFTEHLAALPAQLEAAVAAAVVARPAPPPIAATTWTPAVPPIAFVAAAAWAEAELRSRRCRRASRSSPPRPGPRPRSRSRRRRRASHSSPPRRGPRPNCPSPR